MSIRFFIAPFDPKAWEDPDDATPKPTSDLTIDVMNYREKLQERWSGTHFSATFPGECILPPEIEAFGGLRIWLQANRQIVSFGTGPKKSFLEFILWHRSYISDQYPLYLFNSSSWDSLLLTRNTTEQDIIEFTGIVR